jgi:hypothetical protein
MTWGKTWSVEATSRTLGDEVRLRSADEALGSFNTAIANCDKTQSRPRTLGVESFVHAQRCPWLSSTVTRFVVNAPATNGLDARKNASQRGVDPREPNANHPARPSFDSPPSSQRW